MKNKHDIIWLENVDSTNEEAKRRISICDNLSVLSALTQTNGKGQRGNSWSSASGMNLLFSIILKYDEVNVKACDQFTISQMAALSVTDFLAVHGIQAKIKWPNDIYVDDKKICGILIENKLCGEWLGSSIIGIGLNINERNFDVNIPNPTSMCIVTGQTYELKQSLEIFMRIFREYYDRYLNITGGYLKIRQMYLSQMWRKDEKHCYLTDGKEFIGIIRGITDIGQLIVENEKGEFVEFAFKEISYILND